MVLFALTLLATLIGALLAVEVQAWMPYVSRRLVRSTLDRMPSGLDQETRSRWGEEIEADLASYSDRPLGGLLFATRLRRRGGRRLAAELVLAESLKETSEADRDRAHRSLRVVGLSLSSEWQVVTYEDAHGEIFSETESLDGEAFVHHPELVDRLRAGETVNLVPVEDEEDGS